MFKNEGAYLNIGSKKIRMKFLVQIGAGTLLLLFGSYIVLTGKTIYNLVNKKNTENEIVVARSEIANLENSLISQYNGVTHTTLLDQGFVRYNNEIYVSTDSTFVFNQ